MFQLRQKTAATFKHGAPVKIGADSAASSVAALTAVSTASVGSLLYVSTSSTNVILGFATGNATASVTTEIGVHTLQEGAGFIGNLIQTASSASSAFATAANIGSYAYLARQTSDTHWGFTLNTPGASSANYVRGVLTELIDVASTVNGRVLVRLTNGGILHECV
jgi:hypothetical protein